MIGQEAAVTGFNSDLLSGLALAGANRESLAADDDGLLYAQEIAMLPLDGVDTALLPKEPFQERELDAR